MNVRRIAKEIKRGNLVIVPTDTVYGILADATNIEAVEKVYLAKKRNRNKPFILIVDSLEMLETYTKNISSLQRELITKYLPGRLTILLEKNEKIDNLVTSDSHLVGIRIPDDKNLIKIIHAVGKPLISTSANLSKRDVIISIEMIEEKLLEEISYIADGGVILNVPSTIVKVENAKIFILREGEVAINIMNDYPDKVVNKEKD